jgi:hypothetical protein
MYMAYLKKTKRSKRKMRKTMRIRGGANADANVTNADAKVTNEQALASLENLTRFINQHQVPPETVDQSIPAPSANAAQSAP